MMHVRNPLYRSLRVFLIVALLSSVLAVVGPGAAATVGDVNIDTPNQGAPVYKKPGESFTVQYDAAGDEVATANFYLVNGGETSIGSKSVSLPVTNDTHVVTIAGAPSPQADGIYDLKVKVGATKNDVELEAVYVDGTAPGVAIDNIPDDVSALANVTGTSSDATSGVNKVEVSIQQASDNHYWNGANWTSTVVVWNDAIDTGTAWSTWRYPEPSTSWQHGETYTVCARATDKAGNVATPVCDTFTYDNTNPSVSITNPPGPGWENSVSSLAGSATDTGSGLVADSVEVQVYNVTGLRYWNGSIWTATESWNDAAWVPDSWTYNMPTLTSGRQYRVTAKATDVAGNSTTTASSTFNYDDVEPTVAITTPDPDQDYYNAMPQFAGTASDDASDVAKVELKLQKMGVADTWWDGVTDTWVVTTTVPISLATGTTNWTCNIADGAFEDGVTYEVSAKSTDNAGNDPWVSDQFTFDTTAPAATIHNIANKVGCSFALISGTSSDATSGVITVTIKISNTTDGDWWDGSDWVVTETLLLATGTTAWTYDVSDVTFEDGDSYQVWARAEDNAGNQTASLPTDTFTYDECPTVALTAPAADANLNDLDEITGTAGDVGGAVVEVKVQIQKGLSSEYWNGTGWQGTEAWVNAVDTSAGGTWATWEYDTSGIAFPDEDYVLRAKSKDDFDQWSEEADRGFTFDATAPSVTIYSIPDPSEPTTFDGTASDTPSSGVKKVYVKIYNVDDEDWYTGAGWAAETWLEATGTDTWTYGVPGTMEDGDQYTVWAKAEDNAGNETAAGDQPSRTFTYAAGNPSFSIDLGAGWNLISLPLIPDDTTIEVVLADLIDAGTVDWADSFFWESGALVEKKWDPPITQLTTMTTGQGYWVSMSGAGTLANTGSYLPAPPQVPSSYDVYTGWNMIGYHATTAGALTTPISVTQYLGDVYPNVQAMYYFEDSVYEAVTGDPEMRDETRVRLLDGVER